MTDVIDRVVEVDLDDAHDDVVDWTEFDEDGGWRRWRGIERTLPSLTWLFTLLVVGGCVAYTLYQLHPGRILQNTTPAGGDLGAHVWGPAYLRDHILPHGRLSGWAPDWYGGFPMYQFYMVVPALMVVAVNLVLPYGIALKIISALGLVTLPVAAWAMGRLMRMRAPMAEVLAVAATIFLFDDTFKIYGGNIASTMAGEFSFSIALSAAILFFGLFSYTLRTGRLRATTAAVFALAVLCHGIVAIFAGIGALALWVCHLDRRRPARFALPSGPLRSRWLPLTVAHVAVVAAGAKVIHFAPLPDNPSSPGSVVRWDQGGVAFVAIAAAAIVWLAFVDPVITAKIAVPVGVVGGLLTAFWLLPFQFRGGYLTDMFYERRPTGNTPDDARVDSYWEMLFPQSKPIDWIIMGLAASGLLGSIVHKRKAGWFLGYMTALFGVWAVVWPQSHLWNARLLPFMYLTRYLLAAMGVVEIARLFGGLIAPQRGALAGRLAAAGVVAVFAIATMVAISFHLREMPGGKEYYSQTKKAWRYSWQPFGVNLVDVPDAPKGYVRAWADWNYKGYENKEAYGEYYGIVSTMKAIGQDRGCGRALWENNNAQDKYGTPMALMLVPFWTNGCVGSMEGLYFEASGSTPYHFLTAAAMSEHSSNPVRRLRYEDGQVDKGVEYLQSLGVRYYLAYNPSVVAKADANSALTPIAKSGPWHVYEVAHSDLVVPLATQPVVVPPAVGTDRDRWLELGTSWFQSQSTWAAVPAANGPAEWQRVGLTNISGKPTDDRHLAQVAPTQTITPVALPKVTVTNVRQGDDRLSFTVDQINVPVLVKVSYFPNWKVSGAKGPYRVAPNQMVVIPTQQNVSLHYGYTGLDVSAYFLTLLGLAGAMLLWRTDRRRSRRPAFVAPEPLFTTEPPFTTSVSGVESLAFSFPAPVASTLRNGDRPTASMPPPDTPSPGGAPAGRGAETQRDDGPFFMDWDEP